MKSKWFIYKIGSEWIARFRAIYDPCGNLVFASASHTWKFETFEACADFVRADLVNVKRWR